MSFLLRRAMMASGVVAATYDPYFEQVVLLMHMEGVNGGTTFTDSSNLAKTVTATSATTSTAQPKMGLTSAALTTTSSRLTTTTMPVLGTADFTIEGWFYPNSIASVQSYLITPSYATSAGWEIYNDLSGHLVIQAGGGTLMTSTGVVTTGAWNHVVWQRKAGVAYLYINGVLDTSTAAYTSNITDTTLHVGFSASAMIGYVDELRITHSVARYTTTFTPPTAAFPNASAAKVYTTLDPANKGTSVTLSGGNLTCSTSSNGMTQSVIPIRGKCYWEVTVGAPLLILGVGITGEGRIDASNYPGITGQLSYQSNGVFRYGGTTGYAPAPYTTGDVIGVAVDTSAGTVEFFKNNVSQGPGPGYSSATPKPIYALAGGSSGTACTVNFGATAFVYTPPVGYRAGLYTTTQYATWNPSDKAGTITLSNGNLTATSTASANQSIRSTVSKSASKWYWEVKADSVGGAGTVIGISNSTEPLTNYPGQTTNSLGYHSNGNYYYNGAVVVIGATYATGDVIGVALDITGGTITFYKNGVSQGSWSYAVTGSLFAIADSYATGTATTANFGATPFTYPTPAGFNPGLF